MLPELSKRFPGLTEAQVLDLADLGNSIIRITEGHLLASNLVFPSKEILSSEIITARTRYCVSDLMEIVICIIEYNKTKESYSNDQWDEP